MSPQTLKPLIEAIGRGDVPAVRRLLDVSPQLAKAKSPAGVSLALHALYHHRPEIARLLVQRRNSSLDLLEAVALGERDEVERLLRADPSAVARRSADGFTPLHYASFFGHDEIARQLVEHGADIDAEASNPRRVRPLHSAAARGDLEICQLLLDRGANPDRQQEAGYTALMSAALHGNRALVELLLAYDADAGILSDDGRSAAEFAREEDHEELAVKLEAVASSEADVRKGD